MKQILLITLGCLFITCLSTQLFADDTGVDGFNGLFFRPNVDGQGILNVDTANALLPKTMHVDSYFQYAGRTISFSDPALGGLTTDLVENQVLMNLTLGVGLFEFLDFGLDIPVLFMQNGTKCLNATCTNLTSYTGQGLGDLRFVFKLRILEDKKGLVGLALASDVGIPTGKRRLFTGGKNAQYEQRLIISKKFKYATLAANVGYRVVDRVNAIGVVYDDSVTFGAAARGNLPYNLFAQATIAGNAFLADAGSGSTPIEFLAGIGRKWPKNISCQINGGAKISDGITAADYRVMGGCGITFGLTDSARKKLNPPSAEELLASLDQEWIIPLRTNQTRLRLPQKEILDDVIRFLNSDRQRKVMIIGSADDRASYDYNMKLATKRALVARDYLFGRGVVPDQVVMSIYGEALPNRKGKTTEARKLNRSIIIREI